MIPPARSFFDASVVVVGISSCSAFSSTTSSSSSVSSSTACSTGLDVVVVVFKIINSLNLCYTFAEYKLERKNNKNLTTWITLRGH